MTLNLDKLNLEQKAAVLHTDGPLMLLAGAGSGKTRTLVSKISYLLNEKRVSPHHVLALTFSNKAAREMRERVSLDVDFDINVLSITTFHAFCAKLLRSEANYIGLSRNFSIYDDSESKAIVKTLLERRGFSSKEINPFDILSYIDDLKNKGYYLGKSMELELNPPTPNDEFYEYIEEYEQELHRANALDFGGLITAVLMLFDKFPEVLERYQKRFKYILVDEYQDTNKAQFELIKQLSQTHRNICVVGDEDQSIYSWRGADIHNILDFEKFFPEVKVIKLEQNYRSTKNIISAATSVIKKNLQRKGKEMWTNNPQGNAISIVECFSDKDEAQFVAQEIALLQNQNVSLSEIAVFYRSNSQARLIEEALLRFKLGYKVIGGVRFYERKEIKDVLSYLRLIVNAKDNLAFSRIINVPTRGIGATTLRKLEQEAINLQVSLWELVEKIVDNLQEYSHIKLSAKVKSSLLEFVSLIREVKNLDEFKTKPSLIYSKILQDSGYYAFLNANKDYETKARLENLEELLNAITQFEIENPLVGISGFLESVTLDSQGVEKKEEESIKNHQVSLMTVHGAKGLEFQYAFIVGAEENVFPSYQSIDEGEMRMEEERRLFYVAMTRAMEKLYILFSHGRMQFGQLKFNGPSRFIDEIPDTFYSWLRLKGQSQDDDHYSSSVPTSDDEQSYHKDQTFDDEEPIIYQVKTTLLKPKFPKGSKINHSLYGNGVVLDSEGSGATEKVLIKFLDGNRKKFMVQFAPLSSIS